MPRIHIRSFRTGDEAALRAVFHASVHELASPHYNPVQLAAWAPLEHDAGQWAGRMRANQPFVAQADSDSGMVIAGFADLQSGGYIDMFFVAPTFSGQGVARALMAHIHTEAGLRGMTQLQADVSLAAERFFTASGFVLQARQQVERAGVVLCNARMVKALAVG